MGSIFEPAGRDVVRDLQQRLELVDRLLRLADEHVDPRELVLHVGAVPGILRDWSERDAALDLPDRLLFPAEVRQREAESGVELSILGRSAKLLLEGFPGLLRVGAHVAASPLKE